MKLITLVMTFGTWKFCLHRDSWVLLLVGNAAGWEVGHEASVPHGDTYSVLPDGLEGRQPSYTPLVSRGADSKVVLWESVQRCQSPN